MTIQSCESLHAKLQWRYAVKLFDNKKKIDKKTWDVLEQSLILSPSSYGLQPWKFLIVTSDKVKTDLRAMSWNQSQVTDCSHYAILCAKTDLTEKDVDDFIESIAVTRQVPAESMAGYRKMMISDVVKGPRHAWIGEWAARQAYIALGTLMTAASIVDVDTCPIEGFDPVKYDAYFKLNEQGLRSIVCCAVGYRSSEDKYSLAKKVRFSKDRLVQNI